MNARLTIPDDALNVIDGDKRAKRAIRCIEHGMALSADLLLHELQDAFAIDGQYVKATPRVRGFMRAIAKHLEGTK
jgi:hypothetical protein